MIPQRGIANKHQTIIAPFGALQNNVDYAALPSDRFPPLTSF